MGKLQQIQKLHHEKPEEVANGAVTGAGDLDSPTSLTGLLHTGHSDLLIEVGE